MTNVVSLIETRLFDVLCRGRGNASEFGADALARSIPADRFRKSKVPLNDPALSASVLDRSMYFRGWLPRSGGVGPNDSLYDWREQIYEIELCVGYHSGIAKQDIVHTQTDESQEEAVVSWEIRAADDQRIVERALCCNALIHGDLDADGQKILTVQIISLPRTEQLGGGKLQRVQPMTIHAWIKNTD